MRGSLRDYCETEPALNIGRAIGRRDDHAAGADAGPARLRVNFFAKQLGKGMHDSMPCSYFPGFP